MSSSILDIEEFLSLPPVAHTHTLALHTDALLRLKFEVTPCLLQRVRSAQDRLLAEGQRSNRWV